MSTLTHPSFSYCQVSAPKIAFLIGAWIGSAQTLYADFTRPDKKGKPIQYVIMRAEQETTDIRNLFLLSSIHNFRRLSLGSFEHSMRALHPSLETLGDVINLMKEDFKAEEAHFRESQVIWVGAYFRKILIGWASFQKVPLPNHGVFVSKLYVDPEFQNRGVGKTLLLSIKTDPHLLPQTKKLYLTTHLAYRDSIRFYKRMGFVEDPQNRSRTPSLMSLVYTIPADRY